jgi:hypothetical protein
MKSVLTNEQKKVFGPRRFHKDGKPYNITAEVYHDDACRNGHNSFSVTGVIASAYRPDSPHMCGCIHDRIEKHFPELRPLIPFHLFNTEDGPLFYEANALYWAGHSKALLANEANYPANWEHFKHTVGWGLGPSRDTGDPAKRFTNKRWLVRWLRARKPELMERFKEAVESVGLMY